MIISVSLSRLIEVLTPLLLVICIIGLVGLNTDYDAKREQERLQALEDYEVSSTYIDHAEILNRYFADGERKFTSADEFTSHRHYDNGNYDVYTRSDLLGARDERVTVNSETQEIKSYWIFYRELTADGDLAKVIVKDYSNFVKGKFDETAQWSKRTDDKVYSASGVLSHIASRPDEENEILHCITSKKGNDYSCLISSHGDTVDISLTYEFY